MFCTLKPGTCQRKSNGSGTLRYTPDADFNSPPDDDFLYTTFDGTSSGGGDVIIDVLNVPSVTNFAGTVLVNDGHKSAGFEDTERGPAAGSQLLTGRAPRRL